jgi:hypothetical protein
MERAVLIWPRLNSTVYYNRPDCPHSIVEDSLRIILCDGVFYNVPVWNMDRLCRPEPDPMGKPALRATFNLINVSGVQQELTGKLQSTPTSLDPNRSWKL